MHRFKLVYFLVVVVVNSQIISSSEVGVVNRKHLYCIILAGGNGERLWPLSCQKKPKQLLEIIDGQTLLQQTIARAQHLVPSENIWISTTQQHASSIEKSCNDNISTLIVEPGSRNTGPAILLSCFELYEKDPEALVIFMPADAFIPTKDTDKFSQFLEHVFDFISCTDAITLLGVKPTYAATGYGYIEYIPNERQQVPYAVRTFHEKPSLEIAQQYLDSHTMLWNIGIFGGKVTTFINEFKHHSSVLYNGVVDYRAQTISYNDIISDSIDYAVLEKSTNVYVLPVDIAWCDVGNIHVFLSIKEKYGALEAQKTISVDATNNVVDVPDKLVALIGVHDLCIVQTEKALLITKKDDAEKVRTIVKILKKEENAHYL